MNNSPIDIRGISHTLFSFLSECVVMDNGTVLIFCKNLIYCYKTTFWIIRIAVSNNIGIRAKQKKNPRSLIEAAFSQLSAERSFTSLSLREVAREAGIAPTSFYRHFKDVDELGLTMVDERWTDATSIDATSTTAYC